MNTIELKFKGSSHSPPLTPRANRALSNALDKALGHHCNYIGVEHLLLGLLEVESGTHVEWLTAMGLDPAWIANAAHIKYNRLCQTASGAAPDYEPEPASPINDCANMCLEELKTKIPKLSGRDLILVWGILMDKSSIADRRKHP